VSDLVRKGRVGERIDLALERVFTLGPLRFEPATRQLFVNGETETLEPRVMQVLALLAARRGTVVSRDELVDRCWDGRAVSEDAINRSIAKVRRIAETAGGFQLETIPRVGYRLTAHEPLASTAVAGRRFQPRFLAAAMVLLVLAGIALWLLLSRAGPSAPEPPSLAVLPFRNLSAGGDYFAEGVAEEILTQLSRQPGLRVAGRTSSWMFRDTADPREIGRSLDVAYILEGSVRRAGRQVRVDVALVGTGDGMRRWSQSFQGNLDDIFAIQARIGTMVAGNLREQIVVAAPPRLSTRGDVYNLYLTARGLLRTQEPAKIEAASELLRRAVQLDRDYAPAWAALASATASRSLALGLSPGTISALHAQARRHAERALRLAPDLAEAHSAIAFVLPPGPESLGHLDRAVRLAPANAELWFALAEARRLALDFEGGLEALRRTAGIDPFWVGSSSYPIIAWKMGALDEALAYEQRMIRHHPDPLGRQRARIRLAAYRRDWSEAYRLSREADRIRPLQVRARDSFPEPIFLRLRVDRQDEAAPLMSYPVVLEMVRGAAPRMADLLRQVGPPAAFWDPNPVRGPALLRLNQQGRGADILVLYDAVYPSPEAMAARFPLGPLGFLDSVGPVVVALRGAGRHAEAERLLALADPMVARILAHRRVPFDLLEAAARVRALQGRRADSLRLLERAVAMGWQWDGTGVVPNLADDPVYHSIRDEPRLRQLDAVIRSSLDRERREVAALAG
jgi:TolB-like protein/DNA-binding winged helix-turn-helix (wHTH) protein/tetratricopeptide (TPR) repeat protein